MIRIYFSVEKKVKFGQAVYVVGSTEQIGLWSMQKSVRMSWNEGHIWTVSVLLPKENIDRTVQYKYAIAKWDNPMFGEVIWEVGEHNRKVQISQKADYYCENRWNMDKITLNLLLQPKQNISDTKFYVIGDCKELGNWINPKLMKNTLDAQKTPCQYKIDGGVQVSFEVYRAKSRFHYYYMKKNKQYTVERHPGRKYYLGTQNKTHIRCQKISHPSGDTLIFEKCNFDQLVYSKVTPRIFLGAYLKNSQDLQTLKKQGVNCVLGIQSEKDFKNHSLTSVYLDYLCQKNDVSFRSYSIEDMNRNDFVAKSSGALKIMRDILKNKDNKIYVHCSAGIYRSAQVVVLYLTLVENFKVEQAIDYVKQKHPVARPNIYIVKDALQYINSNNKLCKSFSHL